LVSAPDGLPLAEEHWPKPNAIQCQKCPPGSTLFCSEKCKNEATAGYHSLLCAGRGESGGDEDARAGRRGAELSVLCSGEGLSRDMLNTRQFPLLATKMMAEAVSRSRHKGTSVQEEAAGLWGGFVGLGDENLLPDMDYGAFAEAFAAAVCVGEEERSWVCVDLVKSVFAVLRCRFNPLSLYPES
jgi:hypothetical protein